MQKGAISMEINITKQPIITNETLFEQTVEQAIDTDFTMPDYCSDIVRILKCKIIPRITSKNLSGDSLSIDGSAQIIVIYSDEDNKVCSYEHDVDFQKILPVGDVGKDAYVEISINQEYANCRAITQKKIDVHGVLGMKIKIISPKTMEIITDIDCEGIQLKIGNCPATNPLGTAEKIVVIEEDLELTRGSGSIKSVLRSDARAIVEQCKLIGNKAVVKGDITVNALYCTDEGKVEKYESRVPFNQIVELNIEGDDCKCDAKLNVMSCLLKPRTNLSGEAKSFAFECKLSIVVLASCDNDIPVIYEAFCTKHDMETENARVQFKKLDNNISERFMCKKTLDFSENTFGTVIDMWCENKLGQVKINNGKLTLNGSTVICLLVTDAENHIQYYERNVDFEYSNVLQANEANTIADAEIITSSCAYTVISESKLEVRIELCISAKIYKTKDEYVLITANINSAPTSRKKKAPMMIYYANTGESVWDIAKSYNSNCSDILTINNLDEDILASPSVLLIP